MQPHAAQSSAPLILLENISKRFGALWANRSVSLHVMEGEIHAVVGENGAGKSTLMKILYGHFPPDTGSIRLRGENAVFRSPRDALQAGIGMVHQQLLILPQLSALENIIVGAEPAIYGKIRQKAAEKKLTDLCGLFGFDLPLGRPAGMLPFAYRQQIEILRALYRGARILILDEPTSLLSPPETDRLLDFLRALQGNGHTVIFVSHRLREVFAISNRVTVLRRGESAGVFETSSISRQELIRLMVSEQKTESPDHPDKEDIPRRPESIPLHPCATPFLELRNISVKPSESEAGLKDFSLRVDEGEILGIGCVVGNGERDLAYALSGIKPVERGEILFMGKDISRLSIRKRAEIGFRWLPADLMEEALLPGRSLWENALLGRQRKARFQTGGLLLKKKAIRWARRLLSLYEVAHPGVEATTAALSGGNLQKLALGRVLAGSPRLVVLEQAARGLDIRSQERLRRRICQLSTAGAAIVLISYDLDELLSLSHRIGILYRGRLMGIVPRDRASREIMGRWMFGSTGDQRLRLEDAPSR